MNGTIKIGKKAYKYAFNQKARRIFMESRGIEYWDDFAAEMQKMEPHPKKGMSLAGMMVFSGMVISAIKSMQPEFDDFDDDELLDHLIANPDSMENLMAEFSKTVERMNQGAAKTQKGNKSVPSSSGKK